MLTYTAFRNDTTTQWLTLVHGASANSLIWKYQIDFFKKYYNLLVLDFTGALHEAHHGMQEEEIYSFEYVANEVLNILKTERIESSHFVGTSMGNLVIRQIMETAPSKANAVVMTSAILNFNFGITILLYMLLVAEKIIPYSILYTISVMFCFPMPCNRPSRKHFLENSNVFSKDMYKLWLKIAKENFALMHFYNLVGLREKVLFINGNQDYLFLPFVKKFVQANKAAELKIIQKSGHGVNIDKKDIYNKEVLSYLRSVETQIRGQLT